MASSYYNMMKGGRGEKKDEDAGGAENPFRNLDRSTVLQEARIFNETPVNVRKCSLVLTKILYMLNQGETLSTREATNFFFAITKLFQSSDVPLRRLVFLCIKELCKVAEDVIIVTSSLMKDMTGKEEAYRAAAIRALCMIVDQSMLQSVERYMKQAVVDKSPHVASAALLASLHFCQRGGPSAEVVKRWANEVQEATNSDNPMVQYHALALLYNIRKGDRLAVNKLLAKFTAGRYLKSPLAVCFLVKVVAKTIQEEAGLGQINASNFDFLESCLRHKSEMVVNEAAHALVNLRHASGRELTPAISVLQLFCSSAKPTIRYTAVRTLSQLAMTHPAAVSACNMDLENLITDTNRSIATLAITTLLKTGNEGNVDRLMKQITSFMNDISDEFKVVVVNAVKALCLKFPKKHALMMTYLAGMLREEGGYEFKRALVDTLVSIVEDNAEARETGLTHLCEFIEDCEHTNLAVRILALLGREGPRARQPHKYIRYIYNRVILENAPVRAAAVTAMAKFAAFNEELRANIMVLLKRCMMDQDDEVRDRATYYFYVLDSHQTALYNHYILGALQVSLVSLERALHSYVSAPTEEPFDLRSVPIVTAEEKRPRPDAATATQVRAAAADTPGGGAAATPATASAVDSYVETFKKMPQIAALGPLFKSSAPVQLTEPETEYVVKCIKHTFAHDLVFQFDCTNTMNDQLLENVTVKVEAAADTGFVVDGTIPCAKLECNVPGTTYTRVRLPEDDVAATGALECSLQFTAKDCDPNTGEVDEEGYPEAYSLEPVEITLADHVQRTIVANFAAAWEELGADRESSSTYALNQFKQLQEAADSVVGFFGMQPLDRSDRVPAEKSAHVLLMAGVFRGNVAVLVRCRLAAAGDSGVAMKLEVRSEDPDVNEAIIQAM
ncbi:coatomer subunit gamma-2-like [Paramacrobiotus metropolitanus]|uniref:coatomer subunit gamma-2-like n=1 Tax=Paramacrobiotus metropolitanus TaxID=2943436 RepID=UPI002445FC4C|nr:coatomer subunit gamma-2-like [Paramacrobiotus metropolitanus]